MSWAEVVKINSDISGEPLNYTDYIYDISVFGANSYVMDPNNSKIWDELAFKSCYIYGHTGIHRYVYDRLTKENLDKLFLSSGSLGRQLNNFHSTDVFIVKEDGSSIEKVLPAMTQEAYTLMEPKIKAAFQRYCDAYFKLALLEETARTEKYGAYTFEEWMYEMFNEQGCYTIFDCFDPFDEHWIGYLDRNEAFLVAVSSSETAINWLAERAEDYRDLFEAVFSRLIVHASQNSAAIKVIAESDELLDIIVNDAVSMQNIAASTEGMMAVLHHQKFTSAVLKSTVAMNAVAASTVATPLIFSFFTNIATSSNALTTINNALTTINNNSSKIYEGQYFVDDLGKAKDAIDNAVAKIGESTTNAAMVDAMVQQFVNNTTYMSAVCDNTNVLNALFTTYKANSTVRNAITTSSVFHYPNDFKIANYYALGEIIVLRNKTLSKNVEFAVENKGAYGASMLIMPVDNVYIDAMKTSEKWKNGSSEVIYPMRDYANGTTTVIGSNATSTTACCSADSVLCKTILSDFAKSFACYNSFKKVDIHYDDYIDVGSSNAKYFTSLGYVYTAGVKTMGRASSRSLSYRTRTVNECIFLPYFEELVSKTHTCGDATMSYSDDYVPININRKIEQQTTSGNTYGPYVRNSTGANSNVSGGPLTYRSYYDATNKRYACLYAVNNAQYASYANMEKYVSNNEASVISNYGVYLLPLIAMK